MRSAATIPVSSEICSFHCSIGKGASKTTS
jgi:hypothetical protein